MSKLEGEHTRVMEVKLVLLRTVDVDHLYVTALHAENGGRGRRKREREKHKLNSNHTMS